MRLSYSYPLTGLSIQATGWLFLSQLRIGLVRRLCLLLTVLLPVAAQAQSEVSRQATELALRTRLQWAGADIAAADLRISSARIEPTGLLYAYPQQLHAGIPVYNQVVTLVFKGGQLRHHAGVFLPATAFFSLLATPKVPAAAAVATALASTGARNRERATATAAASGPEQQQTFSPAGVARRPIVARLVWAMGKDQQLHLAWNVNVDVLASEDWLNIRVDAATGQVLDQDNWTVHEQVARPVAAPKPGPVARATPAGGPQAHALPSPTGAKSIAAVTPASYLVVPFPNQRPDLTPPTTDTNPWLRAGAGNAATTYGWHFDGTTNYTDTRGNNVWAYDDSLKLNAPGRFAASTGTAGSLVFNYTTDFTKVATLGTNRQAATVNLFYWNNLMHDVLYQYGFTEATGNFQTDNQGRGGTGGDYVHAEAQDGGGTNNANFATPPDGTSGRMQMYLFDDPLKLHVTAPASAIALYDAVEGLVSINNKLVDKGAVSGPVVYFDDAGTSPYTHTGCNASATDLTGKIVLVSDANLTSNGCNFEVRIKAAQVAGAMGVIIWRTATIHGNKYVFGGPDQYMVPDNTITIPAVMVSNADGVTLGNLVGSGLEITMPALRPRDGDFDSSIITHEYGHGISNRLTGGGANTSCLRNYEQAGEGWSDFFALMMTTDWATAQLTDGTRPRGQGSYVRVQPTTEVGSRRYPYSTDLSVNPLTYADMAPTPEVHAIGEIWCATLWDLTWNIIQLQGSIEPNLYNSVSNGGNAVALQLVMQGLKLQPCQPGFLDSRDAILAADSLLYNGRYHCAIWGAFARRGMGYSAREGSSSSPTDQTAAFDLPTVTLHKNTQILTNNRFDIAITANCECQASQNTYSITNQLPADLEYVSSTGGGALTANNTVTFANQTFAAGQQRTYRIQAHTAPGKGCAVTLPVNDDRDANQTGLTPAVVTGSGGWTTTAAAHSGAAAWLAPTSLLNQNYTLTSAAFTAGEAAVLSFYQYTDLITFSDYTALDGGLVAISTDNGVTWQDAAPYFLQGGYNMKFVKFSAMPASVRNLPCFGGRNGTSVSGSYQNSLLDLSSFNGQTIRVRFQLLTNLNYNGSTYGYSGWYIDDVKVMSGCGGTQQVKLVDGNSAAVDSYKQVTFLTPFTPPTITSFSPASGPVGTSVVVTGTNFTGTTSVTFNGTVAPGFTVDSPTQLTVNVPGGATTGVITVTNGSGQASSATSFTVTFAPVVVTTAGPTTAPEQVTTAVDALLTVTDADSPALASASVSISSGLVSGEDVLTFAAAPGISGAYAAGTGVLTLTGPAPVAQWQQVLRSVRYLNTSDAPTTAPRTLTVVVNDGALNSVPATKQVQVQAVNDAPATPTDTDPAANTVAENSAAGTPVGLTVTAVDPDGPTLSYALTDNAGGRFAIDASTGVVRVANGALLDYETATSHSITVQASDGLLTSAASFTVQLTDVNEAPVVANQSFSVYTNAVAGALVGTVVATDPDAGQTATLSYSITGGNTGRAFALAGNQLRVATPAALAPATYSLSIRVTDSGSPALASLATLTVTVTAPPCLAPTAVAVGNLTPTSARVSFTGSPTATGGYTVTYTPSGGAAQTLNGSGSPLMLNGLSANTAYAVTVRSNCGGPTATSAAAGFTTPCPAFTPLVAVTPSSTLYLGYGPQTATLTASGGSPGATYRWTPAAGLSTPTPTSATATFTTSNRAASFTYSVTVTNPNGCSATTTATLTVIEARCGNKNDKVMVCHNGNLLCIDAAAVATHLSHGDALGSCPPSTAAKALAQAPAIQASGSLLEAFPNPFTTSTTVRFRTAGAGPVQLRVYNALGQLVATLYDGNTAAGQVVERTLDGTFLSAGLYTCRLSGIGPTLAQRLVLTK